MKTKMFLIVAAVMFAAAQPAAASLITIDIEAVVDSVDDPDGWLEGKINPGDIITGSYTYESSTGDSNPSESVGDYEHFSPPAGIWLSVGGFDFETDAADVDFLLEILNDVISGGLHDGYIIRSYSNLPLYTGVSVDHISWVLSDYTASALPNDGLPAIAPILTQWESIYGLRLHGERGGYIVDAHVTSAIPEPSTTLLLLLGIVLLRNKK